MMSDDKPTVKTTHKESVRSADETTYRKAVNQSQSEVEGPADETTYRKAVNQIRINIQKPDASYNRVHIYSFNIPEDTLKKAYALLDKEVERRLMKVTFSLSHNFVIRYMPSRVHDATASNWHLALNHALNGLVSTPPEPSPPGCETIGTTSFQLGERQKQPDAGISPTPLGRPSVVLEVGDSESLTQLKIDARLWLEHMPEVQLVTLILIDPPRPAHPTTPRITVQLWRGQVPAQLSRTAAARQRQGVMVWEADWSLNATPLYVLLCDVFGVQAVPAAYGNNDRAVLDTAWLRQKIINSYM